MLVAIASLKGSPGVTTFALALAARWPTTLDAAGSHEVSAPRCVVVECDPSGGDIAARFALAGSPGLVSLAAAARRGSDPALMWRHTQALPGGLPVVTAPAGADQARAALAALAPDTPTGGGVLQQAAGAPGVVVIADCGRLDPGSVAVPVVRGADVVLLLTGAHADDLAHLAARLPTVGGWSRLRALLLVGDGYPPADVSRELGVPVLGRVPADPRGAALLRGHPARRGASRSGLGRSARQVGDWVTGRHPTPPAAPPHQPTAAAFRPPTSTVDTWSGVDTRSAIGTLAPIVAPRMSGHVGPDAGSRNGDRP